MAYRRRQGAPQRVSAFKEETASPYTPPSPADQSSSASSTSSLAAKAIRASSSYRDSSLSSVYGPSGLSSPRDSNTLGSTSLSSAKDSNSYEYASMKNLSEPKQGFWGVLARKAKTILEDDNSIPQIETPGRTRMQVADTATRGQDRKQYHLPDSRRKKENPSLQKGLDTIASSLSYIGGKIGNSFEEGLTIVENRTADIIQETRKLQIRKKGSNSESQNHALNASSSQQQSLMQARMQPQPQTDLEIQLKASRDVAMAMAAKAKLLLRELKTVKADLAFAKERCAQLEEENRILRECREKGDSTEDDDLIRLQLETLLAEKARLAQENSVFSRENRFLREIVEYHQLTMQDVVYLDEGSEEVTEVYPIKVPTTNLQFPSTTPTVHSSPSHLIPQTLNPQVDISPLPTPSSELAQVPKVLPH